MANFSSGRDAAIARRRALAAGKAALPPPSERTRAGFRDAQLPTTAPGQTPVHGAAPQPAPQQAPQHAPQHAQLVVTAAAGSALSGRTASMVRRRLLAAGKAALQNPGAVVITQPAIAPANALASANANAGALVYAPKVVASTTQHGVQVTGSRIGRGNQVTGDERGTLMPVSGSQYIDAETGGAWRASGTKVGHARTQGGLTVSGTLVRSAVRITGDERGEAARITGKVDPRVTDDLTARPGEGVAVSVQFQRQANPHAKSTLAGTFAGNLGRSARQVGSRQRGGAPVIEATEAGTVITGSAIGRSVRVTGDESGACRPISGSQYLAPARLETACGGQGGGTAPAAHLGADRPDPVTASKVTVSATWGGQRVTGLDVEHNRRVTGDAPGTCAALTGTQYQGPGTIEGACATAAAKSATARRILARASLPVTGDTPAPSQSVSGLNRGAARDITGTPYAREDAAVAPHADPVGALDAKFSIRSPQRAAQRAAQHAAQLAQDRPLAAGNDAGRITGSFAVGGGKVTGNFEFNARPRSPAAADRPPAHVKLSGEGSCTGRAITGDSWSAQTRVTGTEGPFAAERNPTERGPKAKPFAGATTFKIQAPQDESRQLVTGMSGYSSKTGARITLSGGAQS